MDQTPDPTAYNLPENYHPHEYNPLPQPEHVPPHHPPAGPHHPHHQPVYQVQQPIQQPPAAPPVTAQPSVVPQPVVHVLSPRGVEYVFLTISLFSAAFGLGAVLIALVNGEFKFNVLAFPIALLLVALPVFGWLFLRLKNAELRDPSLQLDASKRRSTQAIQIITFLVSFFTLIGFVATIMAAISGNYKGAFWKVLLDVIVVEAISGGILAYYWRDEHRQ